MVQLGKLKGKLPEELPSAPSGMPAEGELPPMEESPLATISDEELLAEMEKRGLSSAAPAAAPAPAGKSALPPL